MSESGIIGAICVVGILVVWGGWLAAGIRLRRRQVIADMEQQAEWPLPTDMISERLSAIEERQRHTISLLAAKEAEQKEGVAS